jgi:LysR family transcriptional regulator, low CO2-responsive transcriptional regulator
MSYAQLKAFHAVAQCGGFSKAAHHLSLTQPAISDHVRKLEEAHGVQLFLRNARGVALTDLGRKLYTITERLLETEQQANELLTKAANLEEGQITIGADAAVHILPQVTTFMKAYPRIGMRLISGNSASLISQLLAFSIDFAVSAERPQDESIGSIKLREDSLVAVAPRRSKFKSKAMMLSELVDYPIVLREEGSTTRNILIEELQKRGLHMTHMIEVEGREAVLETVAQGLGFAVMSAGEVGADARLKTINFSDWEFTMEEWLLFLRARSGLHLIKSFLGLVAN